MSSASARATTSPWSSSAAGFPPAICSTSWTAVPSRPAWTGCARGDALAFARGADGTLLRFAYAANSYERLEFERVGDRYVGKEIVEPTNVVRVHREATIKQSLFDAGQRIGLDDRVVLSLANIFQWDIDFVLDIREGDRFQVVFEERRHNGKPVEFGDILAAEFVNQGHHYRAVRYVDADGDADFYNPEGEPMRKQFLRAPFNFSPRISSRFNLKRRHPLFGRTMPHRGIDYAAPVGTPVLATGDGTVEVAGRNRANGNYIILRHGGPVPHQVSPPVPLPPQHAARSGGAARGTRSVTSARPATPPGRICTTSSWSMAYTGTPARSSCRRPFRYRRRTVNVSASARRRFSRSSTGTRPTSPRCSRCLSTRALSRAPASTAWISHSSTPPARGRASWRHASNRCRGNSPTSCAHWRPLTTTTLTASRGPMRRWARSSATPCGASSRLGPSRPSAATARPSATIRTDTPPTPCKSVTRTASRRRAASTPWRTSGAGTWPPAAQGAPLVPPFHDALFRDRSIRRAILNIGGIANVTVLGEASVTGFDTGPGNALLDAWIRDRRGEAFDRNGAWSAGAEPIPDLLGRLQEDAYLREPPPKSTGKERYHLDFIRRHLGGTEPASRGPGNAGRVHRGKRRRRHPRLGTGYGGGRGVRRRAVEHGSDAAAPTTSGAPRRDHHRRAGRRRRTRSRRRRSRGSRTASSNACRGTPPRSPAPPARAYSAPSIRPDRVDRSRGTPRPSLGPQGTARRQMANELPQPQVEEALGLVTMN